MFHFPINIINTCCRLYYLLFLRFTSVSLDTQILLFLTFGVALQVRPLLHDSEKAKDTYCSRSVAVLIIIRLRLRPRERYVLFAERTSPGTHGAANLKIPVGTLDETTGEVSGGTMARISEKTGFRAKREYTIDMTAIALEQPDPEKLLHPALFHPGGCSQVMLQEMDVDRKELDVLRRKYAHTEMDAGVRLQDYSVLFVEGRKDPEIMAVWALYEGLYQRGKLHGRR